MRLQGKTIGVAMAGSLCNMKKAFEAVRGLVAEGADVIPVLSENARHDSRFGKGEDWVRLAREITGHEPLCSIPEVEPFGPKKLLDCIVVLPCTGNTVAKLANAITDTPVTMAVKAHLRNGRPAVLAVTTNDGLGLNAKNIGILLAARNIFFVPFGQDNPVEKPTSIDARLEFLVPTILGALEGRQVQPLLMGPSQ